jgi:hypothetical protein
LVQCGCFSDGCVQPRTRPADRRFTGSAQQFAAPAAHEIFGAADYTPAAAPDSPAGRDISAPGAIA